MAKVIQEYKKCIGCGTCVVLCSDFWKMIDDKAKPKKGKKNSEGNYEFELQESDLGCNKDAADSCPIQIIKIIQ